MSGSDGSVVIDTELDRDGFDAGSDKLIKSLEKLTASVDSLGDKLTGAFQGVLPLLQSVSAGAGQAYASMSSGGAQAVGTANQVAGAVQQAGAAMASARSGAAALSAGVASLDRDAASLSGDLAKIETGIQSGFANPGAVLRFQDLLDSAEIKARDLRARMAELAAQRVPTEDYTFLSNAIKEARDRLSMLKDRQDKLREMGVAENSKQWQSLAYDIEQVRGQIANYKADMAGLEASGGAFIRGSDTEQYKTLETTLRQTDTQIERGRALIDNETLAQARLNVQAAQEAVIRAKNDGERQAALVRLRAAQQELNTLAAELTQKGGGAPPPEAASRWTALGGVLRGCAGALLTVAKNAAKTGRSLAKIGFKAIGNRAKNYTSKLLSLVKANKSATLTSNGLVKALTSVKTMLISRVKRMFISAIVNNLRDGMQSLAQFSTEFNRSMSEIQNTSTQLTGDIAVAFGSLIETVEPVVTRLLSVLSKAMTYVNMFFALLNGKKTITVAKKGQESYAKATEASAEAQEELNAELFGFDQLTKQQDDSEKDSAGAGDEGGISYQEVPIDLPADVLEWAQKLKDAWKNGDWSGVGKTIAAGLNAGMKTVDNWINGTLRPLGVTWAGRVADILNGLVDGLDFTLAGKTVADGLNTILDIYNTFMTTFDFEKLGTKLGDGLNGFVNNANWKLIGASFAAKWQALVDLIYGFVHRTNWANLGTGIGVSIQSWFDTINWTKMADAIITGINGIVTAMRNTIQNINWGEIGTKLANAITTLFTTIDWGEISGLLSDAILALLQLCMSLLADIDWYSVASSLGKGIIDMIMNIDWLQILATLGSCIISCVGGAVEALLGLIGGIAEQLADAFLSVGGDAIAGFFQGIADAMSTAATWIKEHIVDPVVNAVKDFFGIHSPSTVFADLGGFIVDGLFAGITNAWHVITNFFSGSGALGDLTKRLSGAWDTIKTGASNAWNSLKASVVEKFNSAKDSLSSTAEKVKSKLSDTWSSVKETASKKWGDIKSTVTNLWEGLRSSMGRTDWASIGSNLVSGLKNGISNAWGSFKSWAKKKFSSLVDTVKDVFDTHSPSRVFAEIGENLDKGLVVGLGSGMGKVLSTAKNLASSVSDAAGEVSAKFDIAGTATASGIARVADSLSSIAKTFVSISDALASMGGLQIPAIAEGTVAPYRARVGAGQSATLEIGENLTAILAALREILSALDDANNGGDINVTVESTLDGRVVARNLIKHINDMSRQAGRPVLLM